MPTGVYARLRVCRHDGQWASAARRSTLRLLMLDWMAASAAMTEGIDLAPAFFVGYIIVPRNSLPQVSMTQVQLQDLLTTEVEAWKAKSIQQIELDIAEQSYQRGDLDDADFHQFEVMLLENRPAYIHIMVSIDDGSKELATSPISTSFIKHRDGRSVT